MKKECACQDQEEEEGGMEEDEEAEIPLDMEDIEAVSKTARQDEDLNTEPLPACLTAIYFLFNLSSRICNVYIVYR